MYDFLSYLEGCPSFPPDPLILHISSVTFLSYLQLKNYKCAECGYSCYLKTDLERHLTNVHEKQRTPCPVCGKRYSDLRQHIRLVHEGHKVRTQNSNIYGEMI